jgi:hypothetical protein
MTMDLITASRYIVTSWLKVSTVLECLPYDLQVKSKSKKLFP